MDLDGDGHGDILSGSWPGELYMFAGSEKGFAKARKLVNLAGKVLQPGSASTVFASDWNGDGHLDLVCGNIEGQIKVYPNLGDTEKLRFDVERIIHQGNEEIRTPGGDAAPILVDWDGDEHLDLLTGSGKGDVLFYRNLGEKGAEPKYAEPVILIRGGSKNDKRPGMRTKICAYDWNKDGKLDLLVGDFGVDARPNPIAAPSVDKKEKKLQKLRLLQLQILTLRMKVQGGKASPAEKKKLAELVAEKKDLLTPRYTKPVTAPKNRGLRGNVFLFLRR